jgi:hypothetical protein
MKNLGDQNSSPLCKAVEAHTGDIESYAGAVEAHSGAVKVHSEAIVVALIWSSRGSAIDKD